jgi:hypothetical protein
MPSWIPVLLFFITSTAGVDSPWGKYIHRQSGSAGLLICNGGGEFFSVSAIPVTGCIASDEEGIIRNT